jgi:hypothetical protein
MNNTIDITEDLRALYHPKSALVFYESRGMEKDVYVEHFDMDKNGTPINAHPLTEREAEALAKALVTEKQKETAFLKSVGILRTTILYINPSTNKSAVVWYTKAQKRTLYFVDGLEITVQLMYRLWFGRQQKTVLGYLLLQVVEDQQRKRHCTLPLFSISMKMAGYAWARLRLTLKTPLR